MELYAKLNCKWCSRDIQLNVTTPPCWKNTLGMIWSNSWLPTLNVKDFRACRKYSSVKCIPQAHNTVALPYRAHGEASYLIKLQILKRFEFTSQAMKSGTIAVPENESDDTAVLFVKGAPSVIQQIADPVTVPPDFTKVSMMLLLLHA